MLAAFGRLEGEEITRLVLDLLIDPSAKPLVSLVAAAGSEIAGYILFTHAELGQPALPVNAALLAPLAVAPRFQSRGIGARLIEVGMDEVAGQGAELVFVLGHPSYYPRSGFRPAGALGFEAPYPIAARNADAWMVKATTARRSQPRPGKVACAGSLMNPVYWQE